MLPGITKTMLKRLKKQDHASVKKHIGQIKAAVQRKKDFLDGKISESGELAVHPKNEVGQLSRVIKHIEKTASSRLLIVLLALEVNTRELIKSVEEQLKLIKKLEKAKSAKENAIKKELEGEVILGVIIEHQITLLIDIQNLTRSAISLSREIKNRKKRTEVGRFSMNLNNLSNFLGRIIFDEEVPNLSVSYNMLRLEGWGAIEKRIMKVKTKFLETQEHLL